jgi:hypothetical protein
MNTVDILDSLEIRFRLGEIVSVRKEYVSLVRNAMSKRGVPVQEHSRKGGRVFFVSEDTAENPVKRPVKKNTKK